MSGLQGKNPKGCGRRKMAAGERKEDSKGEAANAFDIPEAVFNGNITEQSDATNEFITYAVGPVAEVINDTLTAYIVGEDDYSRKNEKVMVSVL